MNDHKDRFAIVLLAILGFLFFWGSTQDVQAKALCPEGRTSTGKCVNSVVSALNRKVMVAFTQPKISQSSKLLSPLASPVQITTYFQNLTVAQSSSMTFETLRGPSSYEVLPHYNYNIGYLPPIYCAPY